jgi:hypothetical protein
MELLAQAFNGIDLAEDERVKIVVKPMKMVDGATFKVERIFLKSRLSLTIQIWDGSSRRCGIEVSPTATLKEIVEQAQYKIDNEPLEEYRIYAILHNGAPASQPWIHKDYELRPKADASGLGVVKSRFGDMTVPLPLFQKNRWQQIVRDSMPDSPTAVVQTGPMEFQASYADEEVLFHVRYSTDSEGEEHIISLLPYWENRVFKVNRASGREMIPDTSRPSVNNILYVKSADGSPPDPTFERLMKYTLGDGSEEFSVRVRKGQTTRDVKDELKSLHAGIQPEKILFEGSEMADEDPVNDWATTTRRSNHVRLPHAALPIVAACRPIQSWRGGIGRPIKRRNLAGTPEEEFYSQRPRILSTFQGSRKNFLPMQDVVIVLIEIPVVSRGRDFKIVDHRSVNRIREVGPMTKMTYQIFTMEKNPIGDPVEIFAPNEISLAQLVTYIILPTGIQLDAGSVFYWNLREIEDPSKADKSKKTLEEIPDKIPQGFNLRVKCSSLHDRSTKKMAHVRYG